MTEEQSYKPLYILLVIAVLVNFSGLFVPLMDPDAGVYASISKKMAQKNDYINLYFHHADWLDKPHFPFWITALFFKIFGYHTWSYKLPGILFTLLGAFYTYLFAKKFYTKKTALWSAIILMTSIHIIISDNDVRAEPFLTGLIIASIYHFTQSLQKKISFHLVAACFFAACAVMTKGIFTLIPIGGAIAGALVIEKKWKELFHWRWLLAALLIAVFILPEIYCLWIQFDQHPEKIVFGTNGVSGIRFFLWDSQFGRFFNTGPIKGKGDYLFYLHTLLWAILPWSIVMYAAIFKKIKTGIKNKPIMATEWFTICGSLLLLFVFSLSSFQLPAYSNIIFPLLAILTADFILTKNIAGNKIFNYIQNFIAIILLLLVIALAILYQPPFSVVSILMLSILLMAFILLKIRFSLFQSRAYVNAAFSILFVALFMNLSFYPDLLKYQSGNKAAFYVNKYFPGEAVASVSAYIPSAEFYIDKSFYGTSIEDIASGKFTKARLLFATEDDLKALKETNQPFQIIKIFEDFHVTQLNIKFINKKTRSGELKKTYLLRLD